MRYRFPKCQHLCLQRHIDALFTPPNKSVVGYPLRLVVKRTQRAPHTPPVQVLVSVSKRRLRHAVDRNRAKRQIREAYRLEQHHLDGLCAAGEALHLAVIWLADAPQESSLVRRRMEKLLLRAAELIRAAKAKEERAAAASGAEPTVLSTEVAAVATAAASAPWPQGAARQEPAALSAVAEGAAAPTAAESSPAAPATSLPTKEK